jgi:hypothetical protein
MDQREFLTEDDLDAMGLRPKRTLQKDRRLRRGLPFVKFHGSVRYRRADVEQFVAEHTRVPRSPGSTVA